MMNMFRRWVAMVLCKLIADQNASDPNNAAEPQPPEPIEDPISPADADSAKEAGSAEEETEKTAESADGSEEASAASSVSEAESSACLGVVISTRAYSAMCANVACHNPNETGGVFLGQIHQGVWYVVEATDAGMNAKHAPHTHEMDEAYENHVYRHLRRMYRRYLDLLGLYHRHPSSFDRFSTTDMETNAAYASVIGNGTVSLLVNVDPDIRLTCYYCPLGPDGRVHPVQVPVLVGDEHFRGTDFLDLIYPDERIQPVTDRTAVYSDKIA